MAELHRVEINEKASSEIEPTEESKVDEVAEVTENQEPTEERPEWLPEKFKSAEDLANAYSELEKKLGQPTEEAEEEAEPSEEEAKNDNEKPETTASETVKILEEASAEFWNNDGQLSEETYKTLEEAGYPKHIVDSYGEGQKALLQQQQNELESLTNGQYASMVEWANETLDQTELNTINTLIGSGDISQAKLAVQGLYARYQNANGGTQPKLVQGAVNGSSTMPFRSMQELVRAQSDPRYRNGDKAYEEEIDRRLAVSDI